MSLKEVYAVQIYTIISFSLLSCLPLNLGIFLLFLSPSSIPPAFLCFLHLFSSLIFYLRQSVTLGIHSLTNIY